MSVYYWARIQPFTGGSLVAETCSFCPRTALWRWVRKGDVMRAYCEEHKAQQDRLANPLREEKK